MALATDITLPKEVKPEFPDKCIVCHSKPDSDIKIIQNSSNPLLAFFMSLIMLFGCSRVHVPICSKCKKRFLLQRWSREIIILIIALVAVFFVSPHFSEWSSLIKKLAVGGIALVAIIPIIVVEVIWPRVFNTTAWPNSVEYEFADSDYALEFYELNEENVIQSDFDDV